MVVKHQLIKSEYFIPNWPIKTLVLGTFNPTGGQEVDYFYGRNRNRFWPAVFMCFNLNYDTPIELKQKLDLMEEHHFGCMDIIKSVKVND